MLNVKKDKVNRLTGKSDFNVGDLKRILNEIPEATNVRFGVITDKGTSCCQEDNMIFELRSIHEKDQGLVDSDLYIFVDAKDYELKPRKNSISLNEAMGKIFS